MLLCAVHHLLHFGETHGHASKCLPPALPMYMQVRIAAATTLAALMADGAIAVEAARSDVLVRGQAKAMDTTLVQPASLCPCFKVSRQPASTCPGIACFACRFSGAWALPGLQARCPLLLVHTLDN